MELSNNVYFVGFMGAGKSTIARRLARLIGVSSLDLDKYIERCAGKSIRDIFDQGGEGLFRKMEAQTLREISEGEECMLVSCGGGIIETEECREILKNPENIVIHLQITSDEAAARISNTSSRPLFKDPEQARELSLKRKPLYEEVADLSVQTRDKGIWEITNEIVDFLKERNVICQ